jgi:hypothetical protein
MDACSQCPHTNDCLKMGSCLDEVNARYLAEHGNRLTCGLGPASVQIDRYVLVHEA